MLKDISGENELPALDIFAGVINHFRTSLEDRLKWQLTNHEELNSTDIFWVLTVPAIWGLRAKCFMREAAEKVSDKILCSTFTNLFAKRLLIKLDKMKCI